VGERTGISYPTLVRYVRLFSDRLPHVGTGRTRRFRAAALPVFRQLRAESGRGGRRPGRKPGRPPGRPPGRRRGRRPGRPKGAVATVGRAVTNRLRQVERTQAALEKKLRGLVRSLQKLVK
jgi:hypothetical protein